MRPILETFVTWSIASQAIGQAVLYILEHMGG